MSISRLQPGCPCCEESSSSSSGSESGCTIDVCWTVRDAVNSALLSDVTARLYNPADELIGVVVTGSDGLACFYLNDAVAGEYAVTFQKICYLDAGGPVDLECNEEYDFTVEMEWDTDACTFPVSICGCSDERIIRHLTYECAVFATSGQQVDPDPMSGVGGVATFDGTQLGYVGPVVAFGFDWINPVGGISRSAQVRVACGLGGTSLSFPCFAINYYPNADGTGGTNFLRGGSVDSDGNSQADVCPSEPISRGYYNFGNLYNPPDGAQGSIDLG